MSGLIITVFLASLVGSLHCAGMCGAFVALCTSTGPAGAVGQTRVQVAYHGGRLVTYTLLGAAAGALGAALDLTGGVFGVQRLALLVAGALMVVFGLGILLRLAGVRVRGLGVPGPVQAVVARGYAVAHALPPVTRALTIGLLSTFLPCGWLYAFAVVAAGTGGAATGALTMAVFWVGTVPVLVGVGVGARALAGPLRRHLPAAAGLALVLVGLVAVMGRFRVPGLVAPAAWADDGLPTLVEQTDEVRGIDAGEMPCCETP